METAGGGLVGAFVKAPVGVGVVELTEGCISGVLVLYVCTMIHPCATAH